VDCLGDLKIIDPIKSQSDPLTVIRSLVCESLSYRVKMGWCYDEILDAYRSALVANMINIAHRLTEVALLLQDSKAIQEVRQMLKIAKSGCTDQSENATLQASPAELKKILQDALRRCIKPTKI
jgi:hypothetical protein